MTNAPYLMLMLAAGIALYRAYGLGGLIDAGIAILGLGFVIFIHELGHFLTAKWCDVHVQKFSIGFGPALPGCSFRWGETTYQIGWVPLGGFVKMVGEGSETPQSAADPRSFRKKAVWQRLAIVSAGVAMNVVLAFACFTYVYVTRGVERTPVVINAVEIDSPAWREGLASGDVIHRIGNRGPELFFDDYLSVVVNSQAGEELDLVYGPRGAAEERWTHTRIEPRRSDSEPKPILGILHAPRLKLPPEESRKAHEFPYLY